MLSQSKENLVGNSGRESAMQSQCSLQAPPEVSLTAIEKKFLLHAERGDCATVKRLLAEYEGRPELDINCVDPLNRSALIAAIENENIELMRLLIDAKIKVKDALLHAIKEEYVEAVEILLEWEEKNHVPGEPYSWEAVNRDASTFTNDITPLILAAHMNNYEILKILLDRGATLPMPHDVRCGCDECVVSSKTDSLRHSQARINAYRALTAPSLIALSSRDPLLTAFELSWQVRRLSRMENEFRDEYNEMRTRCQTFATSLLDHARTSHELEVMLNHNPDGETWEPGERQPLERLKLAIKYKQKRFVAHPSVQQLLAAIWYEGLPGFRRKGQVAQIFDVAKLGAMFPVYSGIYMMAPTSEMGMFMKKPFVKFICHSTSYAFFLMLLGLASQRVEFLLIEWFGTDWMRAILEEWKRKERGSLPGLVEFAVIIYVFSLIWSEVRSLWSDGLMEYVSDLWNIVDFITNCFYMMWICLRFTSVFVVKREAWNGLDPWYPREEWDQFDPMLLSEGAFAAGMIFSFLKLVHIFSVNPHLGPLQISLGRMIIDILKFFFIYSLVLFAFGCGMNQLMWYYADLERAKCYHTPDGMADFDNEDKACSIWRRFSNLFETSQSLFWASFGMVDLMTFELTGIKSFTRFWALLLFGSYSVINIIVLLNMLIAMMSNSYQIISERSDTEWKFARSHLWMSYFEDGDTVPPPFNLIPTTKGLSIMFGCVAGSRSKGSTIRKKNREKAQERHDTVMHLLVRRYVTAEQRKRDDVGITEDDVMEIRQDISTLRFELIDILRNNGMNCPNMDKSDTNVPGKKGRVMERRLLKDFQIGFVEGVVNAAITDDKEPKDVFSKIARAIGRRTSSQRKKKDWNAMVRRSTMQRDPIGSTSEFQTRQSLRRHIIDNMGSALESMDPDKLIEYNPKLSLVSPAARVAYAKFKMRKIQQEYKEKEDNPALVEEGEAEREAEHGEKLRASAAAAQTDSDAGADDEVFASAAAPLPEVTTLDETSSIVRPRPRSSVRSVLSEVGSCAGAADFRARTPIPEEPRDESRSVTPAMERDEPKEVEEPIVEKAEASKAEASTADTSRAEKKPQEKEKVEEEKEKEEERPAPSSAPKPAFAPSSKRGPWL